MSLPTPPPDLRDRSLLDRLIWFCLANKLVVFLLVGFFVIWGLLTAPFDWQLRWLPRLDDSRWFGPVAVDAIPDIGENQQIVFTAWEGRSPQDVENQVTYPLTSALLGLPGVKTVRSYSMFGFSTVFVIFKENVEFYWSRSRVLERLNSLPEGSLPAGVRPMLGPDATALGQVFWYTLEGRDPQGRPTGGWDLHELRAAQDWYVRYALQAADGISEVASVGGFVPEYQVDLNPDALRAYGVTLDEVANAVRASNLDVGARTIEVNKVEYLVRGVGFLRSVADLENTVVKSVAGVPVLVRQVATVQRGPALREGVLDKSGAEAVGGVATVRHGANPLQAIKHLKRKVAEIAPGMPRKAVIDYRQVTPEQVRQFATAHGFAAYQGTTLDQDAWVAWLQRTPAADQPSWVTLSQLTIVPFYDRTGLIHETLDTLKDALTEEILITVIVILLMVMHLRSSLLISMMLPLTVLVTFIGMKVFQVDANIVALSGIAIAIGTIVDMGIIMCENILNHLDEAPPEEDRMHVIFRAASEVGSAVLTAIMTTIVGFLPVFAMMGAEGKLFRPLAFTKTFCLFASVIIAITIIPALAHLLFAWGRRTGRWTPRWSPPKRLMTALTYGLAVVVLLLLATRWQPLGFAAGYWRNALFVFVPVAALMGTFFLMQHFYQPILRWLLDHKALFLCLPVGVVLLGALVWLGMPKVFGWLPQPLRENRVYAWFYHEFPGLGKEFMPPLDEGSFLYMPTTMAHAALGEGQEIMRQQDLGFENIPEIESAVGKLGRAESPLDPAPTSMVETVINYYPEYLVDDRGQRRRFRFDPDATDLARDPHGRPALAPDGQPYTVRGAYAWADGKLVEDPHGRPFRAWRPPLDPALNSGRAAWAGVQSPDDIWQAIVAAAEVPGATSAPKLQPIAARIVMLQSGMRAPMGVKIKGPDLATIERVGVDIERLLKEVPGVAPETVVADRIVGKPYLELAIDREAAARYGVSVEMVQETIELALGGMAVTTTVEGRERYPVRLRYQRELRDQPETLGRILVPGADMQQIPLEQLARIEYRRGPQMIRSEDTFLTGYVLFDKQPGYAEVNVVEAAQHYLAEHLRAADLRGVSYSFAGTYENQLRAAATLRLVVPLALFIIFMILYFQFRAVSITTLVFSGILVSWGGGFVFIWLMGQDWFLNFSVLGANLREVFQFHPINLSVAIWVGFLALFGIASDDGVVMATYLEESFAKRPVGTVPELRAAVVAGAFRRVRPCLMTSATTILALLPVLTASGRGADIMLPMAIPSFGGMMLELTAMFVVPVLYCALREFQLRHRTTPEPVA